MLHANGHQLIISLVGRAIYDEQGHYIHSHCILIDISAQHKLEHQLKKSEAKYRSIFLNAAAGIATTNSDGKFLSVNAKLCDFLGYSEAELLGLSFRDITHSEDIPDSNALFAQSSVRQQLEQSMQIEKRYLHKSGKTVWGLLSYSWVKDKESNTGYAVGLIQDITEKKQAEQDLTESEQRFSRFMDNLPGAVFIKEQDGRTVYVNSYLDRHLGTSEWIGKTITEVFPGETGLSMSRNDLLALDKGQHNTIENLPDLNGNIHSYQTHKFAIHRQDLPPQIGGIAIDVTAQI